MEKENWEKDFDVTFPERSFHCGGVTHHCEGSADGKIEDLKKFISDYLNEEKNRCELVIKRTIESTRIDELNEVSKIVPGIIDSNEFNQFRREMNNAICDRLNKIKK